MPQQHVYNQEAVHAYDLNPKLGEDPLDDWFQTPTEQYEHRMLAAISMLERSRKPESVIFSLFQVDPVDVAHYKELKGL
jgi:hypothetical protein